MTILHHELLVTTAIQTNPNRVILHKNIFIANDKVRAAGFQHRTLLILLNQGHRILAHFDRNNPTVCDSLCSVHVTK